MKQLSVRLSDVLLGQIDALAEEWNADRTTVVRRLLEDGLRGRPKRLAETPSREELIALLAEKARMGNVSAIRSLLAREEDDPRAAAAARFFGEGDK